MMKFKILIIIIIDNPSVKVLGNLAYGVFDGKITDNDEVYYIEPSDRLVQHSTVHLNIQ